MSSSRLLIDEHPLQVIPSLAEAVGLNEAIFLQQLHYWLRSASAREHDGRRWIYNTYDGWHEQFPFWSRDTVKRVIRSAETDGYVLSTKEYNARAGDQTKWYSIDYERLEEVIGNQGENQGEDQSANSPDGPDQSAESHGHRGNLHPPRGQSASPQWGNLHRPLPETTTETTTESLPSGDPTGENARAKARVEKDEPNAGDFVAILDEELRGADVPLLKARKDRYGREFRQALAAGVSGEILYRAADRIVERWTDDNHYKLTVDQAVGDVTNGSSRSPFSRGPDRGEPTPERKSGETSGQRAGQRAARQLREMGIKENTRPLEEVMRDWKAQGP